MRSVLLPALLPLALAGVDDTVDQLRNGYTIVPLADQVTGAPVVVVEGSPPSWLSGTLARHACGVYGETGREFINEDGKVMLNSCDHVFDCIEMGQGYHFHNGEATFTSRYYNTRHVAVWGDSGENMNHTSVWWGTVYATQNRTAIDFYANYNYTNHPDVTGSVPAVSWWQVGQDVLGMSEWPSGVIVDPHTMEQVSGYPYSDTDFIVDGWHNQHSPAHEQYEADGTVWSSAAIHRYQDPGIIGENKRIIYTLDPKTKKRQTVAEWNFENSNITLCEEGKPYPNPKARLRQVHSIQSTENFIVVPETSYMYDPCVRLFYDPTLAGWEQEYNYEEQVPGLVTVMNKTDFTLKQVELPPLMITHVLGAYEDQETNELHFDVLKYDNALAYTYYTYLEHVLDGTPHPDNMTRVWRFTLDTTGNWSLKADRDLMPDTELRPRSFEFSNINPNFLGKKYRFGYLSHNVFKLDGAVVKLDVDTGETIQKKLPTGLFPTEPIFVPRPGATEEEDGVVVMSGIDGGQEKGYVIIYNATTMDQLFLATGPRKTLFGVHSKFFPFTVGCSQPGGDCTPTPTPTTTPTVTPTGTPTATPTGTPTTTTEPNSGSSIGLSSLLLLTLLLLP